MGQVTENVKNMAKDKAKQEVKKVAVSLFKKFILPVLPYILLGLIIFFVIIGFVVGVIGTVHEIEEKIEKVGENIEAAADEIASLIFGYKKDDESVALIKRILLIGENTSEINTFFAEEEFGGRNSIIKIKRILDDGNVIDSLKPVSVDKFKELLNNHDTEIMKKYYVDKTDNKLHYAVIDTIAADENGNETITYKEVSEDYKSRISQYSVPSEFLFTLLLHTQNIKFTSDLIELMENSEIDITIKDNKRTTNTEVTNSYKEAKTVKNRVYTYNQIDANGKTIGTTKVTVPVDYIKTTSEINDIPTSNNTVNSTSSVKVTKVKTWYVVADCGENVPTTVPMNSEGITELPDGEEKEYTESIGQYNESEAKNTADYTNIQKYANGFILKLDHVEENGTIKKIEQKQKIKTTTTQTIYQDTSLKVNQEESKKQIESIKKIIDDNKLGQTLDISLDTLCFELEHNDKTKDMSNIMKYIMHEYNGKDYGVTSLDYSIFEKSNFTSVSSGAGVLYSYLTAWENSSVYNFSIDRGTGGRYITQIDGKNYYNVYYGGSSDQTYNLPHGIVISRNYNDNYFVDHGIYSDTLRSYKTDGQTFTSLTMEQVEEIYKKIVDTKKAEVISQIQTLNLKDNQINAIVAMAYQYGNIGNFIDAYNNYYVKGEYENFKKEFKVSGYTPLDTNSTNNKEGIISSRVKANWNVFKDGVYLDSQNEPIVVKGGVVFEIGNGYSQTFTSSSGRKYIEYKQNWGNWVNIPYSGGTIANSGCSITSVSIILSGYGINMTPDQVLAKNPSFSVENSIKNNGISADYGSTEISSIISHLKNKKPVVVHLISPSIYTTQEHWMAVLDIDNNNKVYLSNPNGSGPNGWVDINSLQTMTNCLYIDI